MQCIVDTSCFADVDKQFMEKLVEQESSSTDSQEVNVRTMSMKLELHGG